MPGVLSGCYPPTWPEWDQVLRGHKTLHYQGRNAAQAEGLVSFRQTARNMHRCRTGRSTWHRRIVLLRRVQILPCVRLIRPLKKPKRWRFHGPASIVSDLDHCFEANPLLFMAVGQPSYVLCGLMPTILISDVVGTPVSLPVFAPWRVLIHTCICSDAYPNHRLQVNRVLQAWMPTQGLWRPTPPHEGTHLSVVMGIHTTLPVVAKSAMM